jgi:NAD(P)-dependent dehydrogenase (short-subunit alcohol dehydrogenase family)
VRKGRGGRHRVRRRPGGRAADELGLVPWWAASTIPTWDAAVAAAGDLDGLDVVYLNAGVYGFTGSIDDLPLDLYRRTVGANIDGVVLGARHGAGPAGDGGGAIVATASVAGIVAFAPNPSTMTKQAVTGSCGPWRRRSSSMASRSTRCVRVWSTRR